MNRRRNIPDTEPFDQQFGEFNLLRIRLLNEAYHIIRAQEDWQIHVRHHTEDLEAIVRQVRHFYESRIPFMERNINGTPMGTIAITSSTQIQINLLTSINPSFEQLMNRLESLLDSGFDFIDVTQLVFRIHIRRRHFVQAKSDILIHKGRGTLEVDGGPNGDCFFRALLSHLLKFDDTTQILLNRNRYKNGRDIQKICQTLNEDGNSFLHRAMNRLKELLGNERPSVNAFYMDQVVKVFPSIQICFWYPTRHQTHDNEFYKGASFIDDKHHLHLVYSARENHIWLVQNLKEYTGKPRHQFCFNCCQLLPKMYGSQVHMTGRLKYFDSHECLGGTLEMIDNVSRFIVKRCEHCLRPKEDCLAFRKEETPREDDRLAVCSACNLTTSSDQCHQYHIANSKCKPIRFVCPQCGSQGEEYAMRRHDCWTSFCRTCGVVRPRFHKCSFGKKTNHTGYQNACYFAYDIEAVLMETDEVREIDFEENGLLVKRQVPITKHIINCIIVQEIVKTKENIVQEDGKDPIHFRDFKSFYEWTQQLSAETLQYRFYAHNNSRYDGRMLFNAYHELTGTIPYILWGGQRVLQLGWPHPNRYTYIHFHDSMFHISGPLKHFTKTFGLPPEEKKGFFPYAMNQLENVILPDIPDLQMFEPDSYPEKTRQELILWHESMKGKPYDVEKELVEYCKQDVKLLKWGLETYIRDAVAAKSFFPLEQNTIAGYCLNLYQTKHYDPRQFPIFPLSNHDEEFIQRAFHGGRTDVRCRYYKQQPGDRILYIDVVSLYPATQLFCPMPYGLPEWVTHEDISVDSLKNFYGFAEIDYRVKEYHFHPVCTFTIDGKLRADLEDKVKVVETSCKIQWMLDHPELYEITKVYRMLKYKSTEKMFISYMKNCLMGKCLSSQTLSPEEGLQKAIFYRDTSHGKLDFVAEVEKGARFENNPGKKLLYKLQANNLWGKFGQRDGEEYDTTQALNRDEFRKACEYEYENRLHFIHPPIRYERNDYNPNLNDETWLCQMSGEMKNEVKRRVSDNPAKDDQKAPIRNKAVAAMVTAHAQLILLKAMHELDERVLYHDTDSIVCVLKEGEDLHRDFGITMGEGLGQWELEHPTREEGEITEFVAIGPKAYGIRFSNAPDILKVKGCNLSSIRNNHLNFDAMVRMVDEQVKSAVYHTNFKFERQKHRFITHMQSKQVRATTLKGVQVGYQVFPHGYDRFDSGLLAAMKY